MTYHLKNKLLAFLGDWAINADTLEMVKNYAPKMMEFYKESGRTDPAALEIEMPVREVFTCPIFSEKFCEIMRDEIRNIKTTEDFIPNPDEDELRQIPEFILSERCPELYASISKVVLSVMNPIFWSLWQQRVSDVHVQIANYNPKGKQKGAWHHDSSSDITVVVPLNTGDYKGGGNEFFGRGIVPPQPSGTAVMFPALTHLHRGLAVEEGDRYLLVFWLKVQNEE